MSLWHSLLHFLHTLPHNIVRNRTQLKIVLRRLSFVYLHERSSCRFYQPRIYNLIIALFGQTCYWPGYKCCVVVFTINSNLSTPGPPSLRTNVLTQHLMRSIPAVTAMQLTLKRVYLGILTHIKNGPQNIKQTQDYNRSIYASVVLKRLDSLEPPASPLHAMYVR